MRARSDKNNRVFGLFPDEEPVGFYMTFQACRPFT